MTRMLAETYILFRKDKVVGIHKLISKTIIYSTVGEKISNA